MTEKEAIKELKMIFAIVGGVKLVTGDECEAIDMAIEALEGNIPLKPVFIHDNCIDDIWECPKCSRRYGNYGYYDYCPKCGQRIYWGSGE